jgi:hypothetical protein
MHAYVKDIMTTDVVAGVTMTIELDHSISAAHADALFASALQRSDAPSLKQVRQAIAAAVGAFGDQGCAPGSRRPTATTRRPRSRGCAGRVRRLPAPSAVHSQSGHTPPRPASTQCSSLFTSVAA